MKTVLGSSCVGGSDHPFEEIPRVIGMNHLLDRDESLNELLDLPDN